MAAYYIETTSGRKGPFPPDAIARGIKQGKIPLGAKLIEDGTGRSLKAAEVAHLAASAEPATGEPPVADSGGHATRPNPQYHAPGVVRPPLPRAQPATYQQPRTYAQPQAYPQQSAYPYPGNAQYPQQAYPAQYGNAYQPYGVQQPAQPYYASKPTSGLAIASMVLSVATLGVCVPTWIGGIICGLMALKDTEPGGPKQGRGLALAGLWTGIGIGVLYLGFFALIIASEM